MRDHRTYSFTRGDTRLTSFPQHLLILCEMVERGRRIDLWSDIRFTRCISLSDGCRLEGPPRRKKSRVVRRCACRGRRSGGEVSGRPVQGGEEGTGGGGGSGGSYCTSEHVELGECEVGE
jgi:hypothetical protein